jgi:hypothetical protein
MTDDYTPTTAEVRAVYASGSFMLTGPGYYEVDDERGAAEFDRWLAEHDRQVAHDAVDDFAHHLGL